MHRQFLPDGQKSKPTFKVLLSIYKPNLDFLVVQLNSIEEQIDVEIELIIRIDGLDQDLKEWLRRYLSKLNMQYKILMGERIGACASYFELLDYLQDYDYVAFADQDDYWARTKLISSILTFENNVPTLSVVGMKDFIVNEQISEILKSNYSLQLNKSVASFNNSLIENIFQGARMTLNRSATDLIKLNLPNPKNVVMHDAWIYLVLSSYGCIREVETVLFLYRQHEGNLIGLRSSSFINRVKRLWSNTNDQRMIMAKEFAYRFPNSHHAKSAKTYSEALFYPKWKRMSLLFNLRLKRSKRRDLVFFYVLLFLRRKK